MRQKPRRLTPLLSMASALLALPGAAAPRVQVSANVQVSVATYGGTYLDTVSKSESPVSAYGPVSGDTGYVDTTYPTTFTSSARARGWAGYGGMGWWGYGRGGDTVTGNPRLIGAGQAWGGAGFQDRWTINATGLTGTTGRLYLTFQVSGGWSGVGSAELRPNDDYYRRAVVENGGGTYTLDCGGFTFGTPHEFQVMLLAAANGNSVTLESTADFYSTATLTALEVRDAGDAVVTGFTFNAASGHNYGVPGQKGDGFFAVTPCRLFDTRNATGPDAAAPALAPGASRVFVAAGKCGVPADAKSISVNVTVVAPPAPGYLTIYPGDGTAPLASSLNFSPGQVRANNAILVLSLDGAGTFGVLNGSLGSTDLVVDVNGYLR